MADYLVTDTELTSVANAIRTKGGTSASLEFPDEFVTAIGNIPTGGTGAISITDTSDSAGGTVRTITALDISDTTAVASDVASGKYFYTANGTKTAGTASGGTSIEEKDVNFIDYDGTLVASKTKAEINAMSSDSELPVNPSHTGLTAQGWNWTVAQLKAQLTTAPDQPIWVGQMYVTANGKTEIDIELTDSNFLHPYICIGLNGTVNIDWGDNSLEDTLTGTSTSNMYCANHVYSSIGSYTIKITVNNNSTGCFRSEGSSYPSILRVGSASTYQAKAPRVYSSCIKRIRIGTGIEFGNRAIFMLHNLESITLPSNIVISGTNVFEKSYSLKSLVIPSSITEIGDSMFAYNYSLYRISIPYTITAIDNQAFGYCYILRNYTISKNIEIISQSLFISVYKGSNIIELPSGITTIKNGAFNNNYTLKKCAIPSTVTTIEQNAFNACYSLTDVVLPNNITSINKSVFYNCNALPKINIPYGVTSIGDTAFYQCYSLSGSLIIPSTVTSIGKNCFYNCYGISEYHFQRTTPPTLGATAFSGIVSGVVIYVPYSADHSILNAYKTASNWSTYASYMQEEPQ